MTRNERERLIKYLWLVMEQADHLEGLIEDDTSCTEEGKTALQEGVEELRTIVHDINANMHLWGYFASDVDEVLDD